ncbi:MAG: amidohydrolase family protein [Ignisphaera sp.]|nr:amidohydrolase family protein [Ignisphaera sp.]MDW8084763.1 amidohydrolase family protein [Ignisphaera sp.]
MKIIDAHMHLGECRIFGERITEEQLLGYIDRYGVAVAVVQPFPGAPDVVDVHNRIHSLSIKTNRRILGMANINPRLEREFVAKELTRVLGSLNFVAIKLHTAGHAVAPANPSASILFEYAAKYRVPLMIHTGPGPFSDPIGVAPRAEEFPEVKLILAHAGFGVYASAALWLAKKYNNIYLETSWSHVYDLAVFIREVPNKVLFGTDLIENVPVEFAKLEGLKVSDEVRELILYKNAKQVFNISHI